MKTLLTILLTSTLALTSPLSARHAPPTGDTLEVHWGDQSFPVDQVPLDVPSAARSAIETWSNWADEAGQGLYLSKDTRVLLASDRNPKRVKRELKLVEDLLELFEKSLPRPAVEVAKPAPAKPEEAGGGGGIPEDPEDGPAPWERFGKPQVASDDTPELTYTWGAASVERDSETVVFLVMKSEGAYGSVLELLTERFEYVAEWAEKEAPEFTGFSLQLPLVGGFIDGAAGNEEWNRDNELVNRLAQLLLARRFGTQPNWIVQGWGWFCEMHLLKAIYCYPYRDEFVYTVEHTSWNTDLKNAFKRRTKQPLEPSEFMDWRRGTYRGEPARISWGLTEFFLRFHPEDWPKLLEEYHAIREEGSRVENGDGTWSRDPHYTISLGTQREVFERVLGKRALREAAKFFAEGKKYKPRN